MGKPSLRARIAMERADATAEAIEAPPKRDRLEYLTLLDAIDAALARDDDGEATARIALMQTYATIWAAIGYGIWVLVELLVRLIVAIVHLVTRRKEPPVVHVAATPRGRRQR
jgi:hypothetical protein